MGVGGGGGGGGLGSITFLCIDGFQVARLRRDVAIWS